MSDHSEFLTVIKNSISHFRLTYQYWLQIRTQDMLTEYMRPLREIFEFKRDGESVIRFNPQKLESFLREKIPGDDDAPLSPIEKRDQLFPFKLAIAYLFEAYLVQSREENLNGSVKVRRHFQGMLRTQRSVQEAVTLSQDRDFETFRRDLRLEDKTSFVQTAIFKQFEVAVNKLEQDPQKTTLDNFRKHFDQLVDHLQPKRFDLSLLIQEGLRLWNLANELVNGNPPAENGGDTPLQRFKQAWNTFKNHRLDNILAFIKASLNSKYKTVGINISYFAMLCIFSPYPSFEKCYLFSDRYRKKFLTEGLVFAPGAGKDFAGKGFNSCINEQGLLDIPGCINFAQYVVDTLNQPEVWRSKDTLERLDDYGVFLGAGMIIPEKVKTVLVANRLRPTLIIRSRNTSDSDQEFFEITLEETAWNVSWIANMTNLLRFGRKKENSSENLAQPFFRPRYSFNSSYKFVLSDITEDVSPLLNDGQACGELSKAIENQNLTRNLKQVDYNTLEVEVQRAFDNCEVIITVNHAPPRSDTMMIVNFQDSKDRTILLSCT